MRQRPTLEPLEPRLLYSADTPSALAAALVGTPDAEHRLLDAAGEFAVQSAPQEIVFIDARTPDSAQLVEDITAQSGRDVELIVLDAERDGLEQISEALAGRENVAALHFIAHGGEGVMQLGNTLVTADSLEGNPGLVEAWSQVLTADADILLYGCDIAATAQGRLLADTLARLTGADVSASDDATGHVNLGGDWNLEYATGAIDVPVALSANTQDAWSHLLPSVVLTSYEPSFANMTDELYEVSPSTSYVQSFTYTSGSGSYTVNQIDVVLYKNASATNGNISVELRAAPSGGPALASGTVSFASLSLSENWVTVSLDDTETLSDGTTYYIRIVGGSGLGNVFVGIDDAGTYAGGNAIIGGTDEPAKDMAFRVVSTDGPVIDLNGNQQGQDESVTFTEQTPERIASLGTITDTSSTNLTSLTVTLTARPDGDAVESLSLDATAAAAASGLTVTYTAATGELSITGSATVATYQTILRGIQYNNTSDAPTATNRIVSVVASDGSTPSAVRTSVIEIRAVNDAPVNNVPVAQTTNEDTALVFSAATSNAISITDDAGTNPVQVTLSGTNGVITLASITGLTFSVGDGTADAAMTFTGTVAAINAALDGMGFMPNLDYYGPASLSITTDDLGSTGVGGALQDADTVAITVNAVNDLPVIAGAGGTLTYTEGDAATLIDATLTLSDVDDVNIESATVTISAGLVSAEDVLSFTSAFGISGTYTAATGVLALTGSATLAQYEQVLESVTYGNTNTFDPSTGVRTITWVVNDGTDNSAGVTSTITLAAVNDAPVNNVPGAQSTNEDTALVFSGGGAISITDDAGANPVQVSLSGTNGVITLSGTAGLTFSVGDGTADGAMTFSGTVAAINAALNGLSFLPSADFNGAATLSINTNDQGNTGGGALSDLDAVAITVNAVNDAPVLVPAAPSFSTITEDQLANAGDSVAALLGASVSDVDAGALEGIAVTGLSSSNGIWQFSIDGGASWSAVGAVSNISALLLRDSDRLRFVPDGLNADAGSVSYRAWDRTSGTAGTKVDVSVNGGTTAFSNASDTASITVTALNDAPVLTPVGPSFSTITEDQLANVGDSVAALLGASVSDVDAGALEGIAVTGLNSSNGTWQFSTDGGATWNAVGGVSNTSALLLRDSDLLRFVPDGSNADAGSVGYRAWDRTSGTAGTKVDVSVNGGTTAFSTASDTALITVTALNDAPVLAPAAPAFSTINEDQLANAGDSVAALLGASVSDVDAGALEGIAVTALNSSNGTWQFSTDGGASWSAVGAVADNNALLLRDSDRLRFVPDGLNADAGSVGYRAWDRTSGTEGTKVDAAVNGGTTAFSTASDTASITVTAVNDAPANAMPAAQATDEDTALVFSSGNGNAISITDVDAGASALQVTLTGTNGLITLAGIAGLTFSLGDGTADGTMTFTGTAAAINAALNGLSFAPTANFNGAAALSVNTSDQGNTGAGGALSDLDVVAITVNAVNDAPVNTVPAAQTINEDTTLVFSGGNAISIADVDAGASPIQVSLTGTNGLITLAGTAGLTFSLGDGTADGTMTFSGTVAAINAALNGLSFAPTANFNGPAALSVNTSDQGNTGAGGVLSDLDAVTITVNAVNDAPVVAGAGGTLAYTEDDPATFIDTDLTLSDVDDVNIESASVTISAGLVGVEDVLSFTSAFGITGTYNSATGVLTLSGSATLAQYEQVLESVTYQNTNTGNPSTAARTITWVVNDGTDSSAGVTSTITLAAVNDAPAIAGAGGTLAYTEGDAATLIDATLALSDVDDLNIDSATVTISAGLVSAEDVLNFTSAFGISGTYTAATGVLSLSGSATLAQYEQVLESVTYQNTNTGNPNTGARTVTWVVNDGTDNSAAITSTITVAAVNDAPVLSAVQLTVSEGGTRVFAPADFSIADPDNGAFTYTVSGVAGGSFEVFNGVTWNAAGSFTTAQVAAGTVRFVDDGDELAPSFSVTANDGAANSATIAGTVSYTPVNDAPVLAGAGGTLAYTEGDAATVLDPTLTIGDVDDLNIESASVTISAGLVSAEDVLSFTSAFGITGGYSAATGVLALSGSATLAEYEQVLESVTYQNTNADNPSTGARTITWVVNDGTNSSTAAVSAVTLGAVNDAPVNAVPGAQATNEDAALVFSAANGNAISIADLDAGAGPVQVVLTGTNGTITLAGIAGLTFSVGDGAADAAMTFSGSVGAINAALNGMSFTPSAEFSGAASVSIDIDDQGNSGTGGALSDSDAVAITVNVVNDAPTVSASGGTTVFTGGGGAVVVDTALAVADVDNTTLAAATVSISGGFQAGQDMLGFSNDPLTMGNITGSYNAATGVLSLSSAGATATLAQWQAALRSVSYDNTSATPIVVPRSVSFDVSDGNSYGPVASHSVTVNPAPVVPPGPPPVVPPPVVPPPVVIGPPPVTPPPPTPAPQPAAAPLRSAGAAAPEEAPIQPVSVDFAERPHNPMAIVSTAGAGDVGASPAFRLAAYGIATASVDVAGGDLLGEVMRQGDARANGLFQSGERGRSAGELTLSEELESMRETLREQDEIQSSGAVVLAAGSLSMTLAYLLWLIRGGALVASALSALPAWRILDPLPVLARASDDEDEEEVDEDDDQAIASFADEPVGARR